MSSQHLSSSAAAGSASYAACVDIGGTKVAVSLLDGAALARLPGLQAADADGLFALRRAEPTAKEGAPDALAQQIIRLIDGCCAELGIARQQVGVVGVSSCGPFVMAQGQIELAAPNICGGLAGPARGLPNTWNTAPIEAPLRAAFARVRVENDGIGALEAERRWGALQGVANAAYLTWSTGVGVGLCVDGRVLRGKNGNAGHAGHMFVSSNDDALCGCGNVGDLEGLVAGNALPRRFGRDAAALLGAARAGEAQALAQVDELCTLVGRALYNLIATLDLERISLGGSVFWHHRDFLLPRLREAVRGKLPALTDACEIVPAGLGDKVGDFGALALVAA